MTVYDIYIMKCCTVICILLKFIPIGQPEIIVSDNGLASTREQAIVRTNGDTIQWRHVAQPQNALVEVSQTTNNFLVNISLSIMHVCCVCLWFTTGSKGKNSN